MFTGENKLSLSVSYCSDLALLLLGAILSFISSPEHLVGMASVILIRAMQELSENTVMYCSVSVLE